MHKTDDTPTLFDTPDAVLVVDARAVIVECNRAFESVLGYSRDELAGRALTELLPERAARKLGPDVLATLCARAAKAAPAPLRISMLRKAAVPVESDLAMTVAATQRGATILSFRAIHTEPVDVEDRAHGQLTAAEAYQLAFEYAPLGIFLFDSRGTLTACNDALVTILGSTRQALLGLDMTTLPNAQIVATLRRALAGERAQYDGEYTSVTAGRRSIVRADFAPVRGEDGVARGGVCIVEEVTERRKLQARLAQSDRLASVGTLAAGVAHEINNPLAYVLSNLEYARRRFGDCATMIDDVDARERISEALEHATDGAVRVQTIVRDLKTFSRGGDESRQNVYLERAIEAALTMAYPLIRGRAKILRDYQPTEPVWADEGRLAQVFLNLVINAAQAIADGAPARNEIRVRVYQTEDGRVCGEVSDTGEGIAPEHVARVFEPFFTTRASGVGTGLGLSVCHGLVTAFGGEILVESQRQKGTTFRVLLPRSVAESPSREAQTERKKRLSRPRRRRLLVVDDETLLARSIELQLKDDHDVEIVATGQAALDRLRRDPTLDLVLCDMMLPDISGMDVYEQARAIENGSHERFVFMTGGSFSPKVFKFLRENEVPCLEKPFTAEQLKEIIDPR
ncbi:MAG: ATP-binding protein [Polyangiales bacterium]